MLFRQRRHFAAQPVRVQVLLSQLPLAISVGIVVVIMLAQGRNLLDTPLFLAGTLGVGALTVLAGALPWRRLPKVARWSIPLLDFVAIALILEPARDVVDGMSMLLAFPVFWIAWSGLYPAFGIVLIFVGSALAAWWPYLRQLPGLPEQELFRPSAVALFMLALAIAATVLRQSMDRQRLHVQKALEMARRQNRLLHTVVDISDVGIVVTDRHGNDRLMNATQRRVHMLGLPPGVKDAGEADLLVYEADGQTPIPPHDRPVRRALAQESFQGRRIVLGDGPGRQSLSVSASPMRDEDGEFDGTVVIFQNVTDLVSAIQARERFIADVSHEYRTPLTSIIGYLDLALDEDLDPAVTGYLTTVQRNAERLLELVTRLLDAAAANNALSVTNTDLSALLRDSVQSMTVRAQGAGVELVTELPQTLPIQADPVKLGQVADNLLSNAVKYSPDGGAVTISATTDGEWAEFRVRDTGIGISAADQEQLFTDFFRTEHVRQAAIPGTGLGLTITRAFVEAHGGTISVDSAEGAGSTFVVRLPMAGHGSPEVAATGRQ